MATFQSATIIGLIPFLQASSSERVDRESQVHHAHEKALEVIARPEGFESRVVDQPREVAKTDIDGPLEHRHHKRAV